MNIHFLPDSVYSKRFIEINNRINNDSIYIVLYGELKHLNKKDVVSIPLLNEYSLRKHPFLFIKNFYKLLKCINKAERVYFHYLLDLHLVLVLFFLRNKKTFWLVWGADLYDRIKYELYDLNTLKLFQNSEKKYKKRIIRHKIKEIIVSKAIKKISYIGTIIDGDYKLISDNFGVSNNRIDFFYANPLKFDYYIPSTYSSKKIINILLGNSGDPTNNHIIILEKLKKMNNIKIYCPLSYGNPDYIKKIIDYGKLNLGDSFIPITEFLSENEYLKILDTIDVAIMNHYRQQALGNIFVLLALGKVVYINSKSTIYDFFIKKGIVIHDTNELLNETFIDFSFLEEETKNKNRCIVKNINSEEQSLLYIKQLYT